MRQGIRFLVKPGSFFNQLQWSSHHWFILLSFAIVASVETHIGKNHLYYQIFADMLAAKLGISWNAALWLVTSLKLVVFLAGAFCLSSMVWFAGNLFGRRTSKRVLFRRLAVVFTVLLTAYTVSHLGHLSQHIPLIATLLYAWGAILGYFAIREQFALSSSEGFVLTLFGVLMLLSSWHFSRHTVEKVTRAHLSEIAKRPGLSAPSKSVR